MITCEKIYVYPFGHDLIVCDLNLNFSGHFISSFFFFFLRRILGESRLLISNVNEGKNTTKLPISMVVDVSFFTLVGFVFLTGWGKPFLCHRMK